MSLYKKHCKPCEDKTPPLTPAESLEFVTEIDNWTIIDNKRLEKVFLFKNFSEALTFVNKLGEIAEAEGHHPDISLFSYNKVKVELHTHSIDGLSENDFILASKTDELLRN